MQFTIGDITIKISKMNLLKGECLSIEIDGKVSEKQKISAYIDYAPHSSRKLWGRVEIADIEESDNA